MVQWLKHLWADALALTPEQRAQTVRIAAWVAGVLVFLVLLSAGGAARETVAAESPWWDAVLQARLVLTRQLLALLPFAVGVFAALFVYQALENSKIGDRVMPEPLHRAIILGTLLLATIQGMLAGVLR